MSELRTWIDLKDRVSGARLKTDTVNDQVYLFIVGMSRNNPRWGQCVRQLGFLESPSQKFLLRPLAADERLRLADFRQIFPFAAMAQMPPEQVLLQTRKAQRTAADEEQARAIATELANAVRLGRNRDGDEVYANGTGRFIFRPQALESGARPIIPESPAMRPALFLRAGDEEQLDECADGVVRAALMGEVLRRPDIDRFIHAVTGKDAAEQTSEDRDLVHEVIDAAALRFLVRERATANDAYGDSVLLYERLPPYAGPGRGLGAVPLPLSLLAQRMLGDTARLRVSVPNAFDGALFAHLPAGTSVRAFRGSKPMRAVGLPKQLAGPTGNEPGNEPGDGRGDGRKGEADEERNAPSVAWGEAFHHGRDAGAQALVFNADPPASPLLGDGRVDYGSWDRKDLRDALLAVRSLEEGGRAVLVLAGDDPYHPGVIQPSSRNFFEMLGQRYHVEEAFEVARELSSSVGTAHTLRVVSLRNAPPLLDEQGRPKGWSLAREERLAVCHAWDQVKARVDEALAREAIREAEGGGISAADIKKDNSLQRPYIAFSKVGQASTMVPKELQEPLHARLSEIEAQFGPVDEVVGQALGLSGDQALSERFSPEQVDAVAIIQARIKSGRGTIIGDETGIGKGRIIAANVAAALMKGQPVVFLTDRANLFSDMARDLRAIGEWGRVRPLILNADGRIRDMEADGAVLAEPFPAARMRQILAENLGLEAAQANMVFGTYSQISGEGSEKALWVRNISKGALLVLDEAHLASGSDSNTAVTVGELTQSAGAVLYSSATWAKSSENLFVYSRAFPETVNVSTLAETMRRGGEAFAEVFSAMLAREGAFLRREHDLSRLDFEVAIDTARRDRNVEISDQMSRIMSSLAFSAGVVKRIVSRATDINLGVLKAARDARSNAASAKLFESRFGTGSMLYQVMRRANAALNVDHAADLALKHLAMGMKPVIVFEDTGEAFIKQALERERLRHTDEDGNLVDVVDENGNPIAADDALTGALGVVEVPTIRSLMRRMLDGLRLVRVRDATMEDLDAREAADRRAARERGEEAEEAGQAAPADPADAVGQGATEQPALPPVAPDDAPQGDNLPAAAQAVAGRADDEVDLAAMARAAQRGGGRGEGDDDGEEDAPAKAKKRRVYKLIPFEEMPDLTEQERRAFLDGMREIERQIDLLPELPITVADAIHHRLSRAGARIAELSGRSMALEPIDAGAPVEGLAGSSLSRLMRVVPRVKTKDSVIQKVMAFNSGEIDAMLINRSAATGLSLHASRKFADRRRRVLIEMQIPENPTDRLQLYGRVNRFDQETFPLIQVASTGIYGEVRQLMMQNKKLQLLSANARSSRDSHAVIKDVPDLLTPLGRKVCRAYLRDNPEILFKLDINAETLEADTGETPVLDYAALLTSRVPLLLHKEQESVYEQVYAMYEDAIVQAELDGDNPLRPNEMDVRARVVHSQVLFGLDHQGLGSAFDGAVKAHALSWEELRRPVELSAALQQIHASRTRLIAEGHAVELPPEPSLALDTWLYSLQRRASSDVGADADADALGHHMGGDAIEGDWLPAPPETPVQMAWGRSVELARAQLEARARLSISGTRFASMDDALKAEKENSTQRAMAKALWVRALLPRLVPGALVEVGSGDAGGWRAYGVQIVLDVRPPRGNNLSQLSQWRVLLLRPGTTRPHWRTLASIASGVALTQVQTRSARISATEIDVGELRLRITRAGLSIMGTLDEAHLSVARMADAAEARAFDKLTDLERADLGEASVRGYLRQEVLAGIGMTRRKGAGSAAYSGAIERLISRNDVSDLFQPWLTMSRAQPYSQRESAVVLGGNMYLASEFAAQTKIGKGVIWTDETGMRHRGVLLRNDVSITTLANLPVRLWMPGMVDAFARRLLKGQEDGDIHLPDSGLVAYTSFSRARRAASATEREVGPEDRIIIRPGHGVALYAGKSSKRRVTSLLRAAQKKIKEEAFGDEVPKAADDPGHVTIQANRAVAADAQPQAGGRRGRRRAAHTDEDTQAVRTAKGMADYVVLSAQTPEKLLRALQMISRGPGLDLYVTEYGPVRHLAKACARDYFVERLRQMAAADPARSQAIDALLQQIVDQDEAESRNRSALVELLGRWAAPTNSRVDLDEVSEDGQRQLFSRGDRENEEVGDDGAANNTPDTAELIDLFGDGQDGVTRPIEAQDPTDPAEPAAREQMPRAA